MAPALLEIIYTLVTVSLLGIFFRFSLKRDYTRRGEMCFWMLFGFVFGLFSFSWLYTVYPLIWMPEGLSQLLGIGLLHLILSIITSIPFLLVGYVLSITKKTKVHIRPFLVGLSFVVAEMMRALFLSLLYTGNNTTLGLHFTAGTIGNALSSTPFIVLAYYGGTFALTFFLTYSIFAVLSLSYRQLTLHTALLFGICVYTYFLPVTLPGRDMFLGIVTTDVPTTSVEELGKKIQESNERITSLLLNDTTPKDIIVLPEDTRFLRSLEIDALRELKTNQPFATIIDGDTLRIGTSITNVSLFFDTRGTSTLWRGKSFLLPFNEYVPYIFDALFRLFIKDELEEYERNHTYTPVHSEKTFITRGTKIGTLICSEMLSHDTIKRLHREEPALIFYQSRLNVFNNNPWFLMHLRSFSKVAASQSRTTIISSNNYAPSYIINGQGKIIYTVPVATTYTEVLLTKEGKVILK